MKNKHGFTIIELLVVIVVIGIIATISVASYITVQKQSRDSRRTASATIINESLEKYYAKNGEYPSVAKVTATDANTPKSLLGLNNLDSFIAPRAPAGTTTNLWKAGAASNTNQLAYTGNTDASASCLTGSTATDVCVDYKIQYYIEKTGTVETIYSRNKAATPPPPTPPPAAPATTTLTIALNAGTAVATTSAASCAGSSSPEYAFRSRTNDGAWSSYTAWGITTTNSSAAVAQGVKYGFQVKSRCIDGSLISSESAASTEGIYIHPINTPSATGLTNSTAGNTTTWAWTAVSCAAGTTPYYAVNSGNDYNTSGAQNWWMGYSADQTGLSWARDTTSQGYNYASVIHAKCANAYTTSGWSSESNYSYYLRNVAAPGGAYGWGYGIFSGRTIYRWTWAEPACGLGAAKSFQWDGYIGDVNNTNGYNMYWAAKGPYYHYWYGASAPSLQDPGWYTGPVLDLQFNGASTPTGIDVYARIKYRCQNPDTLRTAEGAWTQSPGYST